MSSRPFAFVTTVIAQKTVVGEESTIFPSTSHAVRVASTSSLSSLSPLTYHFFRIRRSSSWAPGKTSFSTNVMYFFEFIYASLSSLQELLIRSARQAAPAPARPYPHQRGVARSARPGAPPSARARRAAERRAPVRPSARRWVGTRARHSPRAAAPREPALRR